MTRLEERIEMLNGMISRAESTEEFYRNEQVRLKKELADLTKKPEWEIPKYFPVWVDSVNSEGRELAMFKCDFSHPRVVIGPAWEMVPDLLGLPDWVNWIAMGEDNKWWATAEEPKLVNGGWTWSTYPMFFHFHPYPDWQNSKIKRHGR